MHNSKTDTLEIVILGSGNVAFTLAKALLKAGHTIIQVFGRSESKLKELSEYADCDYTTQLNKVKQNAQIYVMAVPDSAINDLSRNFPKVSGMVVHTSGSTPMQLLSKTSDNYGVFYPFQTFTKGRDVNLTDVPFCIEASNNNALILLSNLAKSLNGKPIEMKSETRQWLHLTGVFSCNFVNHMLAIGQLLAEENGFNFDMLKPLIAETISKAMEGDPLHNQTGPAIRGDSDTIKKHVALLSGIDDDIRDLYMSVSTSILNINNLKE